MLVSGAKMTEKQTDQRPNAADEGCTHMDIQASAYPVVKGVHACSIELKTSL